MTDLTKEIQVFFEFTGGCGILNRLNTGGDDG